MKILVAVEDADCVKAIGDFALKYPWPENCKFKVVHVVSSAMVGSFTSMLPTPMAQSITEERRKNGKTFVDNMAARLRESVPGCKTTEDVIEGSVKVELVDKLKKWQPDLVVMGSHGKRGVETLGSVSRAVVTESPCSVMVVPIPDEDNKKEKKKEKKASA